MRRALLTLVTFGAIAVLSASSASAQAASTINMNPVTFDQPQVQVAAGDMVVWNNPSGLAHTVTADDSSFDSGDVPASGQFSMEFDTPGTYAYHCAYHGDVGGVGMSGVIIVQ